MLSVVEDGCIVDDNPVLMLRSMPAQAVRGYRAGGPHDEGTVRVSGR
jgi:hypothetical protein